MADFWNRFEDLVPCISTLSLPAACAIAGHATGGGAIPALACDDRFAATAR
jgi:enoyl-CoA hydratase/carnithine racemase